MVVSELRAAVVLLAAETAIGSCEVSLMLCRTGITTFLWASVFALPVVCFAQEKTGSVLWVSTLNPEHSFWAENLRFSRAAARDLGFELEPVFLNSDQGAYARLLDDVAADPRYVGAVLPNLKNQAPGIIARIQKTGIPTVTDVIPMDFGLVGEPRRTSAWIAELRTDEEENGRQLLLRLVESARTRGLSGEDGRVDVIAIGGSRTDSVGRARLRGFDAAVAQDPMITVRQVFHSEQWSRQQSARILQTAIRRYPTTTVIWSANDDIAIGVIETLWEMGREPGTEFAIGGIDATPEMLSLVLGRVATLTIGGLTLHGAWSLVVLHDYLEGSREWLEDGVITISGEIIDAGNVQMYVDLLVADASDVDFLRFSAVAAHGESGYRFAMRSLVETESGRGAEGSR